MIFLATSNLNLRNCKKKKIVQVALEKFSQIFFEQHEVRKCDIRPNLSNRPPNI